MGDFEGKNYCFEFNFIYLENCVKEFEKKLLEVIDEFNLVNDKY